MNELASDSKATVAIKRAQVGATTGQVLGQAQLFFAVDGQTIDHFALLALASAVGKHIVVQHSGAFLGVDRSHVRNACMVRQNSAACTAPGWRPCLEQLLWHRCLCVSLCAQQWKPFRARQWAEAALWALWQSLSWRISHRYRWLTRTVFLANATSGNNQKRRCTNETTQVNTNNESFCCTAQRYFRCSPFWISSFSCLWRHSLRVWYQRYWADFPLLHRWPLMWYTRALFFFFCCRNSETEE